MYISNKFLKITIRFNQIKARGYCWICSFCSISGFGNTLRWEPLPFSQVTMYNIVISSDAFDGEGIKKKESLEVLSDENPYYKKHFRKWLWYNIIIFSDAIDGEGIKKRKIDKLLVSTLMKKGYVWYLGWIIYICIYIT